MRSTQRVGNTSPSASTTRQNSFGAGRRQSFHITTDTENFQRVVDDLFPEGMNPDIAQGIKASLAKGDIAQQKLGITENKLGDAQSEIERLKALLTQKDEALTQVTQEKDKTVQQLSKAQYSIIDLAKDAGKTLKDFSQLQQERDKALQEKETAVKQKDKMYKAGQKLKTEFDATKSDLETTQSELHDVKSDLETTERTSEQRISSLKIQLEKAQADLKTKSTALEQAQEKNKTLSTEALNDPLIQQTISTLTQEKEAAQAKVTKLQEQNDKLLVKIDTLKGEKQSLEELPERLKIELSATKSTLTTTQSALKASQTIAQEAQEKVGLMLDAGQTALAHSRIYVASQISPDIEEYQSNPQARIQDQKEDIDSTNSLLQSYQKKLSDYATLDNSQIRANVNQDKADMEDEKKDQEIPDDAISTNDPFAGAKRPVVIAQERTKLIAQIGQADLREHSFFLRKIVENLEQSQQLDPKQTLTFIQMTLQKLLDINKNQSDFLAQAPSRPLEELQAQAQKDNTLLNFAEHAPTDFIRTVGAIQAMNALKAARTTASGNDGNASSSTEKK